MARGKPIVGIDLGGTNMQIGVVDAAGNVIGRSRAKTMASQGAAKVIARIVEGVNSACQHAGITAAALGGIGIGAPGAIDAKTGGVLEAVNLRWVRVPLAKLLRDALGKPVLVDNDVNAAVFGEWRRGSGKGVDDLLGVWVGTGIGGGLILGGRMYQGPHFSAGEIGHTTLLPGAPLGRRSLEQTCSRTAVADRLVALIRQSYPSSLAAAVIADGSPPKSRAIAEAYKAGDELTVRVVDEAADYLGIAVANICTVLSISRVVLGGGLTEAIGDAFVKRVRKTAREYVFPTVLKQMEVVASRLEDDAGVVGAALMARDAIEGGIESAAWAHVPPQLAMKLSKAPPRKPGGRR